jgi:hypothetical protein
MGSFRDLLDSVGHDPAMLVWLDGQYNRKGKPNENYAREVMELFTLGINSYTETDVKQLARAFTGWTVGGSKAFFNKQFSTMAPKPSSVKPVRSTATVRSICCCGSRRPRRIFHIACCGVRASATDRRAWSSTMPGAWWPPSGI